MPTTTDQPLIQVTVEQPQITVSSPAEELSGRIFTAAVEAMDLMCIHLGLELGLYSMLAEAEALPADELADRAGIDRRYAQEWLQQQAITGLVTVQGDDVRSRTFALAEGVVDVLLDPTGPMSVAPLAYLLPTISGVLPELQNAYRSGAGVPYGAYGPAAVSLQGALNRPQYLHALSQEWLPTMPDVVQRLQNSTIPARIADIGCGVGWSSIALAKAYPAVRVVGIDDDARSIEQATANAAAEGVSDRVTFVQQDCATWTDDQRYDLICFFECIHDMPHPAQALLRAREALAPGGSVLVMDENAAETFTAPGDEVERFFAATSVTWCLPQSRTVPDSAAIGTLIRPETMRVLATTAGFSNVNILPIEHPFWRFYRLTP